MLGGQPKCSRAAIRCRPGWWFAACLALALAAGCTRDATVVDRLVAEGVERARSGDTAAALERFDRALAIDPEHPAALVNGGLAALLEARPADARDRLERFLARDETTALPRVYLAHARLALGDREGAIAALQDAVRLGFRDLDALADGSLGALRNDLRFIQLAALVAQKHGRRAPTDVRGRPLFGDSPVRSLAAPGLAQTCSATAPPPNE